MKYKVTLNGKVYEVEVESTGATLTSVASAPMQPAAPVAIPQATPAPAPVAVSAPSGGEPVNAPMPGTINDIKVSVGDSVKSGQIIVILEAMKMENEIVAPRDGRVSHIAVSKGDSVNAGTILLKLE